MDDSQQALVDTPGGRFLETMRVLIVGGIPAGVLIVGVGSRLAMLLLRLTSPDHVNGVESDDGFTMGEVTFGGTYNLLMIGAVVGIIGAGVYLMVSPWLIGPKWFRRLTIGLAAAAVAGSMLVHADGVDFTLLKPTWLAIGVFVALPGLFGVGVGMAVDAVKRPDSWTRIGRRQLALPIISVVLFPFSIPFLLFVAVIVGLFTILREIEFVQRARMTTAYGLTVRSLWLLVAVLGVVALVNDVDAVTARLD